MINYVCSKCGKKNVKLWREYNVFLNNVNLLCVSCAMKDQNKEGIVDEKGMYNGSDQIGWYIPAVPTVEMDTFWGYCSVPFNRVLWWKSLKTF